MEEPRKLLAKGELDTLGAWKYKGMVYIRGRFSPQSMVKLVGSDRLPLVVGSSRLAYLLAWEAHAQDHNLDTKIVTARMRRQAWVTRARYPAKAAITSCMVCRLKSNQVA